jgi:hypothetical protein
MSNNSPKSFWQSLDATGKMVLLTLVLLAWNTSILILFIPTMLKVNSVATKIESTLEGAKGFFGK